jgi:hypothetical protein
VVDPGGLAVADALVAMGLTSTLSDENGNFRIALHRAARALEVRAIKQGFLPARFRPDIDAEGGPMWPLFVELRLPARALAISGTVVDAQGAPVPGAMVWPLDTESMGVSGMVPLRIEHLSAGETIPPSPAMPESVYEAPLDAHHHTDMMKEVEESSAAWGYVVADARGSFELTGLQDREYRLEALKTGTILRARTEPIAAGRSGVVVRLPEDAAYPVVVGRVVLTDGETPVADATLVELTEVGLLEAQVPGGSFECVLTKRGRSVRTDEDGWFEIEDVGRENSGFYVYGDEIIGRDYRFPARARVEDLTLEVSPRLRFEVVLGDPVDRFDQIAAIDANGKVLKVLRETFSEVTADWLWPLHDGRSGVLTVQGDMCELILMRDGEGKAQIPVTLTWGETTVIRY